MSARKPPIGPQGPAPIQLLKALPPEEQEFLYEQRGKLSARKLIAQHIEGRLGIHGLREQRLSEFWRWLESQWSVAEANESVDQLRQLSADLMTPEDVHRFCLDLLRTTGMRLRDLKTLKFVTREIRAVMQLAHSREKWREEQREKIEAGLDAVGEDIKDDAVAVELFEKIKSRIAAKQEGRE